MDVLSNMEANNVRCANIGVDCVEVDPNLDPDFCYSQDNDKLVPSYYGFDFFVPYEQKEEMMKYIEITIKELKVPLIKMSDNGEISVRNSLVFDKERIFDVISKSAPSLIEEGKKHTI